MISMRCHSSFFLALFACAGARALANDIEPGKEFVDAHFTTTPIVINGQLDEWSGIGGISNPLFAIPKGTGSQPNPSYVSFEEYDGGTWFGLEDHSATFQFAYDLSNAYVGIVVTDDYHENSGNSAIFGDAVQIMVADGTRSSQVALYNYGLGGVDGSLGGLHSFDEAGPGGATVAITRDTAARKTYYEIKLPASSLGLSSLQPGITIGMGFAVNDGDEFQPGQRGWSGLGPHSIVFGKSPGETALVTFGAVPEPAEIGVVVGLGLVGFFGWRRRGGRA